MFMHSLIFLLTRKNKVFQIQTTWNDTRLFIIDIMSQQSFLLCVHILQLNEHFLHKKQKYLNI